MVRSGMALPAIVSIPGRVLQVDALPRAGRHAQAPREQTELLAARPRRAQVDRRAHCNTASIHQMELIHTYISLRLFTAG